MSIFLVDSYSESNYSPKTLTEILRPDAAGDLTELTPYPNTGEANWEDVDEAVADDNTTYVKGNGGSFLDLYDLPAHSGSGIINKITVYARIKCQATPAVTFHTSRRKAKGLDMQRFYGTVFGI